SIGVVYLATQSHRRKIISGAEGLIGEKGVVKDELNPRGRVTVHGEVWNAECEGTIPAEQEVIVL
ncbi:MAG: nodulation protein NfeD, partial [Nitrospinaceae bacterium]|nr:nodulation protein NfeD [Nitrospinaceae bacterium]NIR57876.1 nodulation protein NfeD [Nitrospinaceae bacterium]NIS88335.1 nodulation protein NfeD [Nitrospinaceae bacterium]NIT85213.1 nodulation protein NfeD [Nitrospinaceae bacterium]NIU47363.1 nodulation protein NfeD [Nitrospinaceae bacterium]